MTIEINSVIERFKSNFEVAKTQDKIAQDKHDLALMKALQVQVRQVDALFAKLEKTVKECKDASKGYMNQLEELTDPKKGAGKNLDRIKKFVALVNSVCATVEKEFDAFYGELSDWRQSGPWVAAIKKVSFNFGYLETMQSKSKLYVDKQAKEITPEIERIKAYKNRAAALLLAASKAASTSTTNHYDALAKTFSDSWQSKSKNCPAEAVKSIDVALRKIKDLIKKGAQDPYGPAVQSQLDAPENYVKIIRGAIKTFEIQLQAVEKLSKGVDKSESAKWLKLKKDIEEALKAVKIADKQLAEYSKLKPKAVDAYKKFKAK